MSFVAAWCRRLYSDFKGDFPLKSAQGYTVEGIFCELDCILSLSFIAVNIEMCVRCVCVGVCVCVCVSVCCVKH